MAEKNAATCRRLSEMVLRSQKPLNIFVSTVLVVNENLFTLKDFREKQKLSSKHFRLLCASVECFFLMHLVSFATPCSLRIPGMCCCRLSDVHIRATFPQSKLSIGLTCYRAKASCHSVGQCMRLNFYIIGERKHVI